MNINLNSNRFFLIIGFIICCNCLYGQRGKMDIRAIAILEKGILEEVKHDIASIGVDTARFEYIVFYRGLVKVGDVSQTEGSISENGLSEVLLVDTASQKVVGTFGYCFDGRPFILMTNTKYDIFGLPCQPNLREYYFPDKCYKTVSKIYRRNVQGVFVSFPELRATYFFLQNGAIEKIQ